MCVRRSGNYFHVCRKGLQLQLFHFDDLAGHIDIESDGDTKEALENFDDEWKGGQVNYFTCSGLLV